MTQITPPVAVYRFFDANQRLIYVGVTESLGRRWRDHSRRDWWPRIASYTLSWHEHRAGALSEEAHALTHEMPAENLAMPADMPDREYTYEELMAAPTVRPGFREGTKVRESQRRHSGEGALYRRADGMWLGAVVLGYGSDGKIRRKTFSSKKQATALAKMHAFLYTRPA